MTDQVPFPRTVPDNVPEPPEPPLNWRAARAFFDQEREREGDATVGISVTGYRMTTSAVVVRYSDGSEQETPWAEVERIAQLDGPEDQKRRPR